MEFLNVLKIKQLAYRKGYSCERSGGAKGRHWVRLTDPNGNVVESARRGDWSLDRAKELLDVLPDRKRPAAQK